MMGLLNRPAPPVVVPVDVNAARKWDQMGFIARMLTRKFAPNRAAHWEQSWQMWKMYGLDRLEPKPRAFTKLTDFI